MTRNDDTRKALDVADTLASIAELHLKQAANALKYSRNPNNTENFHFREALSACANLDLFLAGLGQDLPDEFEPYKALVKRQADIWGEGYAKIRYEASLIDWRSQPGRSSEWHVGKAAARVVRVYEQVFSDEGEESFPLALERELTKEDPLFAGISGAKTFECILEGQELRLDVERTLKTNRVNPDSDKGKKLQDALTKVADDVENKYLLQQMYEGGKHA